MYPKLPMLLILFFLCSLAARATADLDGFLSKPEPAYAWKQNSRKTVAGGTVYDLNMTSQTWQGRNWEHRVQVFFPANAAHPHYCVLLNTGGHGGAGDEALGMTAAKLAECPVAILYDIPNQPLYGGLTEDALVVYTWQKFLETGDASWPLHFPMTKAVIKAMDTVQALARVEKRDSIEEFLVTGASKRGWTAWLAGASRDPRIKAIAPMVIDTLNVAAQGPHQLAAYGKLSNQVDDYTRADIPAKLQTPAGRRLLELEDPYSYRDRLTLPKLIILGTNDRYWAQDALNLYWDDLKGPKWVMYTPNSGHDLSGGFLQVVNTLTAFARAQAVHAPWPQMMWMYSPPAAKGNGAKNGSEGSGGNESGIDLKVTTDQKPTSARLFRVYAKTQDFRDSKWTSEPMRIEEQTNGKTKAIVTGHLDAPAEGYAATYGEITYEIGGKPFALTTQIHILKAK